jgi:hypothetical protein
MGLSQSSEESLPQQIVEIREWDWAKTLHVCKTYVDGEFDFGIDAATLSLLAHLNRDDADFICKTISMNDTGVVNSLVLIYFFIILSESHTRNETVRVEALFDVVDFNMSGSIFLEDLAVSLLCVAQALGAVLGRSQDIPSDAMMYKMANHIYSVVGKPTNSNLKKSEFTKWAVDVVLEVSWNLDGIFDFLVKGPPGSKGPPTRDPFGFHLPPDEELFDDTEV